MTSGFCTLFLTAELPALSANVRIEGPGQGKLTVRRQSTTDFRIFTVTSATDVTISGLVITNGKPVGPTSGGAIANTGSAVVNVIDSFVTGNSTNANAGGGGAIANTGTGTINVVNSNITDNIVNIDVVDGAWGGGGGIINSSTGTVNVSKSFVVGNKVLGGRRNSVMAGAGIFNPINGTVNVTDSFISGNTLTIAGSFGAHGGGGGISVAGGMLNVANTMISDNVVNGGDPAFGIRGGGLLIQGGSVSVSNSAIFNNQVLGSGGGIANSAGILKVTNSTLTANKGIGGGIFGTGTIKSSLIAKNIFGALTDVDVKGEFTSEGFNFIGIENGSTGFTAPTDQKGTGAARIDPKLDPNGIPIPGTAIQAPGLPLCGSPVIDKGTSEGQTTDIRGTGFSRTLDDPDEANAGDGTDTGAFERQTPCGQSTLTVNNTSDGDDANPGDGNCDSNAAAAGSQCSLRAALREANAVARDYTINFAIPTNDPGFDQSTGRHTINFASALPDVTQGNLVINGPGADKLTVRRNTGFFRIFTFAGVVENITLSGLTVSNGFNPTGDGGAVSFSGKTLNVNACLFNENIAGWSGGAIFAFASDRMNVTSSTFVGNFSSGTGSFGGGGAIHIRGPLTVTDSTFTDNIASGYGGAINAHNLTAGADSNITDCQFDNNGADAGGGIAAGNFGSITRVTKSTFRHNTSTVINSKGGAIFQIDGTLNVVSSTLSANDNYAIATNGGASIITTNITDSTINGNTGGGVLSEDATTPSGRFLNITNSTISDNVGGPGIKVLRITLNISNSTISHNEGGGVLRLISENPGTWTVKSSIIANNPAFADVLGAFTSGGYNVIGNPGRLHRFR